MTIPAMNEEHLSVVIPFLNSILDQVLADKIINQLKHTRSCYDIKETIDIANKKIVSKLLAAEDADDIFDVLYDIINATFSWSASGDNDFWEDLFDEFTSDCQIPDKYKKKHNLEHRTLTL